MKLAINVVGFFFSSLFSLQMALNEPTISTVNPETFLQKSLIMQLISKMGNYEDISPLNL